MRSGTGRTLGATATDGRALARLEIRVDGRLYRGWTLAGVRAARSAWVSPSWLRRGQHLVRWTAWDAAGNVRTRCYWLTVR